MYNEIKDFIETTSIQVLVTKLKQHPVYIQTIEEYCGDINTKKFTEKVYLYYHQLKKEPCSCGSGKYTKFISFNEGYRVGCSLKCPVAQVEKQKKQAQTNMEKYGCKSPLQNEDIKQKIKETNIERYGVENVFQVENIRDKAYQTNKERYGAAHAAQSEEIKNKTKQTFLERYGVENPQQTTEIQNKTKQTNMERYGCVSPLQHNDIKQKAKKTNLERYGVEHQMHSEAIQQRLKQTNMERYGVENPQQNTDIRVKTKQTNMERYGVENPLGNEQIQQKVKKTNLDRYGSEYPQQRHLSDETLTILNDKVLFEEMYNEYSNGLYKILGIDSKTLYNYLYKYNLAEPGYKSNKPEQWLVDLFKPYTEVITNDRTIIKPYELDVVLPEYKLAIEHCGLYWHSEEQGKDKHYHKMKYDLCKEQGIRLITIFEDELLERPQVIKETLLGFIGAGGSPIYARKCSVEELTYKQAKQFLNDNHIQGSTSGSVYVGMIHDDTIVGCMVFKTLGDTKWELVRWCTSGRIVGGASKAFKYFIKTYKPNEVKSFSDNRWFDGAMYEILGFENLGEINPDYSYILDNKRHHKFGFRKKNIKSKFGVSIDGKTESQLIKEIGALRIWDCGKIKWVWVP